MKASGEKVRNAPDPDPSIAPRHDAMMILEIAEAKKSAVHVETTADRTPPTRTHLNSPGPGHQAPQRRPLHRYARDPRDLRAHRRQLPLQPPRVPHRRLPAHPRRRGWPRARLLPHRALHQARAPPRDGFRRDCRLPLRRRPRDHPHRVPVHLRRHRVSDSRRRRRQDAVRPRHRPRPGAVRRGLGEVHLRLARRRPLRRGLVLLPHPGSPLLLLSGGL